ncbi:MAG: hypothetical protein GY941_21835 [Planctomycetes bacterium]|nr:hypothetical protein [Planctomycetota bacterium]
MRPSLATGLVLSLIGTGCDNVETEIPVVSAKVQECAKEYETAEQVMCSAVVRPTRQSSKVYRDFWTIAMWEGRGRINCNAINVMENARGPVQIRPIFLQDANEWLRGRGLKEYTHEDMHSPEKAFVVCQAYWRRYGLQTTEERCRAHAGGPDGPWQECTVKYWAGCQTYLTE